jgi:hypothetical protein
MTEAEKLFALRYCDCKTNANAGTQGVHEKVNKPPMAPRDRQLNELDGGRKCDEPKNLGQMPPRIANAKCQSGKQKDRRVFDVVRGGCDWSILWRND